MGTFHALCARVLRRDGAAIGLDRALRHLRHGRPAGADEADPPRGGPADHRRVPAERRSSGRSAGRRTRCSTPTFLAANAHTHREREIARLVRRYQARLRAVDALDFDDLLLEAVRLFQDAPDVLARYQEPVALPPRRRVPGHEPAAVPVGQGPGRRAPQPLRRRRRRPVDLLLARRRHPQHPRLRARLPERHRRQARAELPLHAADPGRGPRRRQPNNASRKDKKLWTENAGGRPIQRFEAYNEEEEAEWIARQIEEVTGGRELGPDPPRRRGRGALASAATSRSCTGRTPRAGRSKRRSCATGSATSSSAARASTSGARSRTPWPTCGSCAATRTQVSFERILNVPARGIGEKSLEELRRSWRPARPGESARATPDAGGRQTGPTYWGAVRGAAKAALEALGSRAGGAWPASPASSADCGRGSVSCRCPSCSTRPGARPATGRCSPTARRRARSAGTNLLELRSVTTRYDDLTPDDALDRFLEETALVADQDSYEGERGRGHSHHPPRRQGPRVPGRLHRRPGGGRLPAQPVARRREAARRGATAGLRRDHPRQAPPLPVPRLPAGDLGDRRRVGPVAASCSRSPRSSWSGPTLGRRRRRRRRRPARSRPGLRAAIEQPLRDADPGRWRRVPAGQRPTRRARARRRRIRDGLPADPGPRLEARRVRRRGPLRVAREGRPDPGLGRCRGRGRRAARGRAGPPRRGAAGSDGGFAAGPSATPRGVVPPRPIVPGRAPLPRRRPGPARPVR